VTLSSKAKESQEEGLESKRGFLEGIMIRESNATNVSKWIGLGGAKSLKSISTAVSTCGTKEKTAK